MQGDAANFLVTEPVNMPLGLCCSAKPKISRPKSTDAGRMEKNQESQLSNAPGVCSGTPTN